MEGSALNRFPKAEAPVAPLVPSPSGGSLTAPSAPSVPWIRVSEAPQRVGERIEVRGWISHRRSSGKIQFLVIRDGSGVMQCVAGVQDLTPEEWSACQTLTQESAVIVRAGADPRHR